MPISKDQRSFTMNWTFLDFFSIKNFQVADSPPNWESMKQLIDTGRRFLTEQMSEFDKWLAQQDECLTNFGGDPLRRDWRQFRPLRLSREEDWSDWLAYLIKDSESGDFARDLFGDDFISNFQCDSVSREYQVQFNGQERRVDLLVRWHDGTLFSMEVKIGDTDLEKTLDTVQGIDYWAQSIGARTKHWILLPEYQIEDWGDLTHKHKFSTKIEAITWTKVSTALRRTILLSTENLTWKVFAYTFTGAVEQSVLGLPRVLHGAWRSPSISVMQQLTSFLQSNSKVGTI